VKPFRVMRRWCMACFLPGWVLAALAACWSAGTPLKGEEAQAAPAAPPPANQWRPEALFPPGSAVYLSVGSLEGLQRKLGESLLGRIIRDPGWAEALRPLAGKIRPLLEAWAIPLREATGKSPRELARLFPGGLAVSVAGLESGVPEMALALDISAHREEIEGILKKLEEGRRPEPREFGKHAGRVWFVGQPATAIAQCVLGPHLVVTTSVDAMKGIAERFEVLEKEAQGKAGEGKASEVKVGGGQGSEGQSSEARGGEVRSIEASSLYLGLDKALQVPERALFLAVDLRAVRGLLMSLVESRGSEEERAGVRRAVKILGLEEPATLGFALGCEDGGLSSALHVGWGSEPRGVLGSLLAGSAEVKGIDEAIARIPAGAQEVGAFGLAAGKMAGGLSRLLREEVPELKGSMDAALEQLEAGTGISVEKDILTLGEVSFFTFSIPPPMGGLFADHLALVRTQEFQPYAQLLKKAVSALSAEVRELSLPGDKKMQYALLPSGVPIEQLFARADTESLSVGEALRLFISILCPAVAHADLPEGWTVVSTSPHAVRRYLEHHAGAQKISEEPELSSAAKLRFSGARCAALFQGERAFLASYNTCLSLARYFSPFLSQAGVDIARLPPAEAFGDVAKFGYWRVEVGREGITLRAHRALTAVLGKTPLILLGGAVLGAKAVAAPSFGAPELAPDEEIHPAEPAESGAGDEPQ
jgi:hypothetical protein